MLTYIKAVIRKVPYARVIYLYLYQRFVIMNPISYRYKFDGLATRANLSFMGNKKFIKYYENSIKTAGRDYRFYLRVHQALWCASIARNYEGDFVELGTGKGFIFAALAEYMSDNGIKKHVYLIDTYVPYKTDPGNGNQSESQVKSDFYAVDFACVVTAFKRYEFVQAIKGRCPEILKTLYFNSEHKIAFLHVDLNYYKAEIESLEFLWEYITPGAPILLDDYANPGRERQNFEYDSFFASKNLDILTLATGQGLVIKNRHGS
jgi:hypothetical protein